MSPLDTVRIIVVLLYIAATLIVYRRLMPRLLPAARCLATFMLGAITLALIMALVVHHEDLSSIRGLWHLDRERNLPSTLASTQLALVGVVAALTALYGSAQSSWQRLYWVGIALLFLLLAREELLEERALILGDAGWAYVYAVVGAVVLAGTARLVVASPRQLRIWPICFALGLVLGAAGAIGLEQLRYPEICSALGFMSDDVCLLYMIEEALELLGIWLVLVAVLGQLSVAAPSPGWGIRLTLLVLPALVVGALLLTFPILRQRASGLRTELEFLYRATPASVAYASDVHLRGYRLDYDERAVDALLVAMVTDWHDYSGLGYSVHLVDQATGQSVSGADAAASRARSFKIGKHLLYNQRISVDFPPGAGRNRALWVVLTTWREVIDSFSPLRIHASDLQLLDETQIVLGELALPSAVAAAKVETLAVFENGSELGRVALPESARPGQALEIRMHWSAAQDISGDYIQFLHFGHEESGEWWVYDQQPLGGRLPARFWRSGLVESEVWSVSLPDDLAPGQYAVFTGLYHAGNRERVTARDAEDARFADERVPLGSLIVERA